MRTYTANTIKKNCGNYRAMQQKGFRDYIPWLNYIYQGSQCTNTQAPTLCFLLFFLFRDTRILALE